jgi:hypothetical protein
MLPWTLSLAVQRAVPRAPLLWVLPWELARAIAAMLAP